MLYCTPNRHLKVCRKILWFPCFPCFSWPRKLEKTNENKKNKKARKCHTLVVMVQGSISGSAFSVLGLDNGERCFLKTSVAKSGGQTKVGYFGDISSITLLLQIKDRRSVV